MPSASIGDIDLHYVDSHDVAQGTARPGPTLLLVHGFPLDHSMWRYQLDDLADAARIIAPELRGFGRSGVTPGTVSMERYADDLAALLDALKIREKIVFCGLSMGGYIAWPFWRKHASRVAKLILCDTRAAPDTPEAAETRRKTAERVEKTGTEALAELMLTKLFAPASATERRAEMEATRHVILANPPQGCAAALRGMAERPDSTGLLRSITVPTELICGEHDGISPPEEMARMAEAMPQARFVEIAGAGHMSPLERPEEVNAVIRAFLAR
jgi:pimeloyl-ACP methyl ester carboxylesterase